MGRFDYYDDLTARQKRTYDKSDRVTSVRLRRPEEIAPLARQVEAALATEKGRHVQEAMARLCNAMTRDLGVPPVRIRVSAKRPTRHGAEYFGLYDPEAEPAEIQLWMRTAKHKSVVKFRTFLRTFLHEFLHHLDYELYDLDDTFHTEGFFKRESSLMRVLVPPEEKKQPVKKRPPKPAKPKPTKKKKPVERKPEQMKLPFEK